MLMFIINTHKMIHVDDIRNYVAKGKMYETATNNLSQTPSYTEKQFMLSTWLIKAATRCLQV